MEVKGKLTWFEKLSALCQGLKPTTDCWLAMILLNLLCIILLLERILDALTRNKP